MDFRPTVRRFLPTLYTVYVCSQIIANTISVESMQYKLRTMRNVYFCAAVLYAFWNFEILKFLNGTGLYNCLCFLTIVTHM